jgi:hypothetical protein
MIEFAIDGKPVAAFEKFMWRYRDMFLMKLERIEFSSASNSLYPIYSQVFDWTVAAGQAILTVYKKNGDGELISRSFIFQGRYPYFGYVRDVAKTAVPRGGDED